WTLRKENWRVAAVLLVIAAVPRLWAAFFDHSIFWPDEIFQTTEQAHRFAFGYGIEPWEFRDGARSWVFPGMLGMVWKVASVLGVSHALAFVNLSKGLMALCGLGGVYLCMTLAERLGSPRAVVLAGAMGGLFPSW